MGTKTIWDVKLGDLQRDPDFNFTNIEKDFNSVMNEDEKKATILRLEKEAGYWRSRGSSTLQKFYSDLAKKLGISLLYEGGSKRKKQRRSTKRSKSKKSKRSRKSKKSRKSRKSKKSRK